MVRIVQIVVGQHKLHSIALIGPNLELKFLKLQARSHVWRTI
jgi:hypothetical protein